MQTQREYLHGLGLTKSPVGRGRFSGQAHEALAKARSNGMTFSDDVKAEPKPAKVKVKGATSKVKIPNPEAKSVDPKAVREWASKNGHKVGERGRIHSDVIEAYLSNVPKEEQEARESEFDIYAPTAPHSFPDGTTFKGTVTYKGQEITKTFSDRTCCTNCRVSLCGCRCGKPTVVLGYGTPSMVPVTPIYPKG